MIFSSGPGQIAIATYVPQAKWEAVSCEDWLISAMSSQSGSIKKKGKKISTGIVETTRGDEENAKTIVEAMAKNALEFLKGKGLLSEEQSDGSEPAAKRCKTQPAGDSPSKACQ